MRRFYKHKFTGKEWEIFDTIEYLNLVKLIDLEGNHKTVPAKHLFVQYEEIKIGDIK